MDSSEFLHQLTKGRAEWDAQLTRLLPEQMTVSGVVGKWSVKDLVSHIAWSEREMVGVLEARALVGSDLWNLTNDERNEVVYQQNAARPLEDVLAESQAVYARLLELVSGMSNIELNDPGQFANMPADWIPWRVLAGNTYIHYQEHAGQLKDWIDRQGS